MHTIDVSIHPDNQATYNYNNLITLITLISPAQPSLASKASSAPCSPAKPAIFSLSLTNNIYLSTTLSMYVSVFLISPSHPVSACLSFFSFCL